MKFNRLSTNRNHHLRLNSTQRATSGMYSKVKEFGDMKKSSDFILFLDDGTDIGQLRCSVQNNLLGGDKLPKSWKTDGTGELKPFLWIELLKIDDNLKGKGLGREAMKRLYLTSLMQGCGGRMVCHTAWNSHDFYAKTGWEIIGKKFKIERIEEKIKRYEDKIENIKDCPDKKEDLNSLNQLLIYNKKVLDLIKKGYPYQEDMIMFNPTGENVLKLFFGI